MLRLWFGSTLDYVIDVNPLGFNVDYGENYAVAVDLAGNPHVTSFSSYSYPTRASVSLPGNQLTLQDAGGLSLRSRLIQFIESGIELPVFEQGTGKCYKLVGLSTELGIPGSTEFSEDASDIPLELSAYITSDGNFSDFDSLLSATWRNRV